MHTQNSGWPQTHQTRKERALSPPQACQFRGCKCLDTHERDIALLRQRVGILQ